MKNFRYADIHCHPNLKTFGHSFDKSKNPKSDMWHKIPATFITEKIHRLTGITKFSQANFSSMTAAKAKVISLSLYPFEKGFFINPHITPPLAALLANWGIEIGYRRIRFLQQHTDYFNDLMNEYRFVLNSDREHIIDGRTYRWQLASNWQDVNRILETENTIAVIISIEGAHVFNTGLGDFGVPLDEDEVLLNIKKVKGWEHAPLFIGLAHNFNNELCGHSRSLQRLGRLVNQEKNLDAGLFKTGIRVIHALLDNGNGHSIYIDLKHMSVLSRQEYMQILERDYGHRKIPLIVSHGSVTGMSFTGNRIQTGCYDIFNTGNINFFDEELVAIARSGGIFGLQMDIGNNADPAKLKTCFPELAHETPLRRSARIIWNQLQHIAVLLDKESLFAWGCMAIGSDFDGSINPFPGILTVESFEPLSEALLPLAGEFIAQGTLLLAENRRITAEEILDRFFFGNTIDFLKAHY